MTCGGCSGAINRALTKFRDSEPGKIDSFDVNLENQRVVVTGAADYDTVLEKIKKTGKEVRWRFVGEHIRLTTSQVRSGKVVT
ncbi:hypothetical protein ID866_5436 [Astraeus odoratus]|nr:hypothetical protein ID866_5436 [Astraeus odoratus]